MPLFVFICGHLSRKQKRIRLKDFTKLIIPYIFFNAIYELYHSSSIPMLIPYRHMWFLLSLFFWRFLYVTSRRYLSNKSLLTFSFLVALLIGYVPFVGAIFSLSRTFSFFPFFVLGAILEKSFFWKITRNKNFKVSSNIVLVTAFVVLYLLSFANINIEPRFFHQSGGYLRYDSIMAGMWRFGFFIRAMLDIVAISMGASLLCMVPTKQSILTKIGKASFTIYILHLGFYDLIMTFIDASFQPGLISLAFSISICLILSIRQIDSVFSSIIFGSSERLLKFFSLFTPNQASTDRIA